MAQPDTEGTGPTPLGPGFTYQGFIALDGKPLDGSATLRFSLWDEPGAGNPPVGGNRYGNDQVLIDVPIADGVFTVVLNATNNFASQAFNGQARWLQIEICDDPPFCSVFQPFAPRQPIYATPYAIRAITPDGHSLDSSNGAIKDSLYVNFEGNVGVSTISPLSKLHVVGGQDASLAGGGYMMLGEDNSSNLLMDDNEIMARANGAISGLFLNAEGGNVLIANNGPGNLGIGTAGPIAGVHVRKEPETFGGTLALEGATHTYMTFYPDGVGAGRKAWLGFGGADTNDISLINQVGEVILAAGAGGRVVVSGQLRVTDVPEADWNNLQISPFGVLTWDNSSRRNKENITLLQDNFERLLDAQPMTYTRPGNPERWEIGYIAEDIHDLGLTRLVFYDQENQPNSLNYEKMILYLAEIAKSQRGRIAEQQEQITNLEARLARLEAMLVKNFQHTSLGGN